MIERNKRLLELLEEAREIAVEQQEETETSNIDVGHITAAIVPVVARLKYLEGQREEGQRKEAQRKEAQRIEQERIKAEREAAAAKTKADLGQMAREYREAAGAPSSVPESAKAAGTPNTETPPAK